MFSLCSFGSTPGSESVYQSHVNKDFISHPLSFIQSVRLLLSVCLQVGKSLISLRMAVQLNGDPSLHQELHREAVEINRVVIVSEDGVQEQVFIA